MTVQDNNGTEPTVDPKAPVVDPKVDPKVEDPKAPLTFDPEKDLTKEQWTAIYGSGRFKQLNEKAAKATELEKAQKAADEAKMAEEGKFKELAEAKDQQLTKLETAVVNAEIKAEAARLGAVNPAIVATALDRANIKFDDGNVTGVSEAVEALKESDPYLFNNSDNNNQPKRVGSATNPGTGNTGMKFKLSELRDSKFYATNRVAIREALRLGQVENDT